MEGRKGGWRYEKEFTVSRKESVAQDTMQFEFTAADGYAGGYDFTAGQYLTVRVPGVGAPRQYTLTSAPGDAGRLQITTRLVMGGQISTHMHRTLQVGDTVLLAAPVGDFTPQRADKPAVLVSAGIGQTPMLNFMRAVGADNVAAALHVDVSPARQPFKEEFADVPLKTVFTGKSGKPDLAAEATELVAKGGKDSSYYLCGPPQFMLDFETDLKALGVDNIYSEVFGTGTNKTAAAADAHVAEAQTATLSQASAI